MCAYPCTDAHYRRSDLDVFVKQGKTIVDELGPDQKHVENAQFRLPRPRSHALQSLSSWTLPLFSSWNCYLTPDILTSLPLLPWHRAVLLSPPPYCLLIKEVGTSISCVVNAGRLTRLISRHKGLPCSRQYARVHTRLIMSVNTTVICTSFCAPNGLVYISSPPQR